MNECINRNSIYNKLQALFNYWLNSIESQTISISYAKQRILPMIMEELPAADVAPVMHGLWMPIRESEMTGWDPAVAGRDPIGGYICSVCKEEAVYDCNDEFVLSKYCPHCGAKMGLGNYEEMQ